MVHRYFQSKGQGKSYIFTPEESTYEKWWMKYPDIVLVKKGLDGIMDPIGRWFSRRSTKMQTVILWYFLLTMVALIWFTAKTLSDLL